MFVDLTADYDTAWHRGLTCKLLQFLPYGHMVRMIMKMVGNRSFTLIIGNGKRSRLQHQEWCPTGICPSAPSLQHLHLWPANHHLQKVCICWRSSNHACWWRLAGSGRGTEQGHGKFLQTWKLKLYTAKTVSAAFHLNKEANLELKVNYKPELKVNFAE